MVLSPHQPPHARAREGAFGVVEVIVAMLILAIVVTGAVMATASSDSATTKAKAVADMNAIAERAFERAHGDLTARSACETGAAAWRSTAAAAAKQTAAAAFRQCTITYTDFRDEQGRSFVVALRVQPVDSATDGTGSNDADGNLRDDYAVSSSVSLAKDSTAGLEDLDPIVVNGSIDWTGATSDLASIRVYACGINRPDRSLTVGGCAVTDQTRTPLVGLKLTLKPAPAGATWNPAKNLSMTSGSNGVADASAVVEPGVYQIVAPATFKDSQGRTWSRFRVEPGGLQVAGAGRYQASLTYVRVLDRTIRMCTQTMTKPAAKDGYTFDDGFEAASTNVTYRGTGSPAYRTERIDTRLDRLWTCNKVTLQFNPLKPKVATKTDAKSPFELQDPLRYQSGSDPYIGSYDLEIEQNYGAYRNTQRYGLKVNAVKLDCSTQLKWNQALNGTAVATRTRDALNDRPLASGETTPWYGRFEVKDDKSHTLCIRLEPKTFDRDTCTGPKDKHGAYAKGAPLALPPVDAVQTGKCFYVTTKCLQYCPDGARVCVANCNRTPTGSLSGKMEAEAAKPFGGPGDPTVGCRPRAQGGYRWYGWSPSVILEGAVGKQATQAQFSKYEWVGGEAYYYNNYSGHYGSGPVFYCEDISFAASWQYLCHEGSNKPVVSSGFINCRYHYGDCIQAELPQYPGVFVRGRMRDISVNYTKPIIPSIDALRALTFLNGIDKPETTVGWSPGTWWSSLKLRIYKVNGDPACDWDENSGKRYEWRDPVMLDIWHRIVDEPALKSPAPRDEAGNTGSDRVAI
jgi:Tfp pilus assembly protein PilV